MEQERLSSLITEEATALLLAAQNGYLILFTRPSDPCPPCPVPSNMLRSIYIISRFHIGFTISLFEP
jgi:hypothetical protein